MTFWLLSVYYDLTATGMEQNQLRRHFVSFDAADYTCFFYNCSVHIGLFFIIPCTDQFIKVDLRTISFDIPPQEVSTCHMRPLFFVPVYYYKPPVCIDFEHLSKPFDALFGSGNEPET